MGRALSLVEKGDLEGEDLPAIAKRLGMSDRHLRRLFQEHVGAANGRNPISIIIPYHRVLGSDGRISGYAGGPDVKAKLLALEGYALTKVEAQKRGSPRQSAPSHQEFELGTYCG
ncbi:MAG: MGMT family protein [Chitinophagaceae bacterium]|nr:MGMT family protein [Oligoflexus sp.]